MTKVAAQVKQHKGGKPKNKPVKHVHHHTHTHNVTNVYQTPPPAPTQQPSYTPYLETNQQLFANFASFLGSLFSGGFSQPQVPTYNFQTNYYAPQFSFGAPGNGSAGGWSAWGQARGY